MSERDHPSQEDMRASAPVSTPVSAPYSGRTRGWVKVLLALSLAVNVAVAGLAAGAFLRFGGPPPRIERDFGLGPLTAVMTREDWRAVRPAFMARHPDIKGGASALRADFDPVVAALRARDFDPGALQSALAQLTQRNSQRLGTVRDVIADYLIAMPPAARLAFADRLEERLTQAVAAGEKRRAKKDGSRMVE